MALVRTASRDVFHVRYPGAAPRSLKVQVPHETRPASNDCAVPATHVSRSEGTSQRPAHDCRRSRHRKWPTGRVLCTRPSAFTFIIVCRLPLGNSCKGLQPLSMVRLGQVDEAGAKSVG